MERDKVAVTERRVLQEMVDAVHALSDDPSSANVERYLASSRVRSTTRVLNPPRRKGTVLERPEILYTAEAAATGGRAGHAATSDGRVDVELDVPKEMGGSGGPGTNPEQLFAVGYAACFQSALLRFANGRGLDLSESRVTARVGIGLLRSGGLGLAVALDLDAPGLSRDVAVDLMNRAHETCPYSRATRGNIAVTLTVGGSGIERQAA